MPKLLASLRLLHINPENALGEVSNLRAFIFKVAIDQAADFRKSAWRRRARNMEEAGEMVAAKAAGPAETAERQEALSHARQAISRLRHEGKVVFLLRQNGELTYEQIAEALQLPLGTVKSRMRAVLSRLRAAIGEVTL